jgi:hypothetical protein
MAVAFGLDRDAIPGILVHPSNVPYVEDCGLKKLGLLL